MTGTAPAAPTPTQKPKAKAKGKATGAGGSGRKDKTDAREQTAEAAEKDTFNKLQKDSATLCK